MDLILYTLSDLQNTVPTGWPIITTNGWPENGGLGRGGAAAQNPRVNPATVRR